MRSVAAKALIVGCLIFLSPHLASAEQVTFSLMAGQSVTVGDYTLQFRGVIGSQPSYDLYHRGLLVARLPSNPIPPNWSPYGYRNLFVDTTAITSDGMTATGTLTIM
jgi:hypothetical protein